MPRSRKTISEMEAKNPHSVTQVNRGAKSGDPMKKLTTGVPDGMSTEYEDLGGPTVENSKPDDESNAIKDPSARLKKVSDAVTRGAKPAEPMQKMKSPVQEEYEDEDEDPLYEESGDEESEEDEYEESEEGESDSEETEESDEDEEEFDITEYDVEDDVEALVAGEELSEEFKEKTRVIYEAAVRSKVTEIKEHLEEQYQQALIEEVQEIAEQLEERVDSYLEYVAEEWIKENELAVQYGIKEQIAESFLSKLFGLFEEHHVNLPEEKYDIVENMVHKLDEMEDKLNEQIDKNMQLTKKLSETVAYRIFDDVADGLAITQQEKLASLAESVEFESADSYREKLETLRESYFPQNRRVAIAQLETLSEGVEVPQPTDYSQAMGAYLQAASLVANV